VNSVINQPIIESANHRIVLICGKLNEHPYVAKDSNGISGHYDYSIGYFVDNACLARGASGWNGGSYPILFIE
jgi:hypothetical protein